MKRLALLVGVALIAAAGSVFAGTWTVTNLGPSGSSSSTASCAWGTQQAGTAHIGDSTHAGIWSGTAGSWVDLNPSGAAGSSAGAICGTQQAGYCIIGYISGGMLCGYLHAAMWSGTADSWVDLHPSCAVGSFAYGTSGTQQAGCVYRYIDSVWCVHASMWSGTAASWIDLNPAGSTDSIAYATSGGQQTGWSYIDGVEHAGLWSGTAGSWVDLNPFGAASSAAYAICGNQQAGSAAIDGTSHAGIWSENASSWVDLNPAEATKSIAAATCEIAQAGYAIIDGKSHAGMWTGTATSWMDLHALLPAGVYDTSRAMGIYTSGNTTWVCGYANNIATDDPEAILWTYTTPEPSSILALLCGIGGLGGLLMRKWH